jgi:glucose/arabinose dehydrogenase
MRTMIVALFALSLVGAARADEKRVKESEVPAPVLAAVAKKYPTAKKTGFSKEVENKKTIFEVVLADGAKKIEVECSPDGKILVEELEIALDAVPANVRKALSDSPKYGKWTVKKAERVVNNENDAAPNFELLVASGTKKAEVVFDKDGKLVKEEIKGAKDND